jgi:hypothetical protein
MLNFFFKFHLISVFRIVECGRPDRADGEVVQPWWPPQPPPGFKGFFIRVLFLYIIKTKGKELSSLNRVDTVYVVCKVFSG